MDYSEKARYEIIRMVFDDNPAGRSVKMIAHYLSLAVSTVEKWGEDPEGSGADMPAKYEIPLMLYCNDFRLLEWMAQQTGRRIVEIKSGSTDGKISDEYFNLGILQGDLSRSLKLFLDDGKLDRNERTVLKSTAIDIIKNCESFLQELSKEGVTF